MITAHAPPLPNTKTSRDPDHYMELFAYVGRPTDNFVFVAVLEHIRKHDLLHAGTATSSVKLEGQVLQKLGLPFEDDVQYC